MNYGFGPLDEDLMIMDVVHCPKTCERLQSGGDTIQVTVESTDCNQQMFFENVELSL